MPSPTPQRASQRAPQRAPQSIVEHFATLPDPRIERCKLHELVDIVVIALAAVMAGAETWVDIAAYGRAREEWFRHFLALPNGIPSHDTFGRVFARLDPAAFQERFQAWVAALAHLPRGAVGGAVVAIDGKSLRGSRSRATEVGPLHLVSAWATEQSLTLGQVRTSDKSNEITAIPELLDTLDIAGAVVTIDAMGCQKAISTKVRERGADYIFTVKENQPWLHERITRYFHAADERAWRKEWREVPHDAVTSVDGDHGRVERRTVTVVAAEQALADREGWADLRTIARVVAERKVSNTVSGEKKAATKTSTETRFFISSLPPDAGPIAAAIRSHWAIENSCHWTLDVAFHEDDSRIRKDHAPENMATIRRWALSLLKQDKTHKHGIASKRLRAGWDEVYFDHLLSLLTEPNIKK